MDRTSNLFKEYSFSKGVFFNTWRSCNLIPEIGLEQTYFTLGLVTEGVLITSKDLFEQNGSALTKDSKYKFIDVKNSGWLNNQIENYVAAVVNIDKSNYTREFIATAYAQIHYQDGSVETIYGSEGARYSDSRSVSYIAKQIKLDSNYYNSLSTTNKNIIDRFANN